MGKLLLRTGGRRGLLVVTVVLVVVRGGHFEQPPQHVDGGGKAGVALVVVEVQVRRPVHFQDHAAGVGQRAGGVGGDQVDAGEAGAQRPDRARAVFDNRRVQQV